MAESRDKARSVPITEAATLGPVYRRPEGQRIIAFGGGKGGAGRTVLVANIGIYLAQLGKKVVVVDAALGGANLHTFLGVDLAPRVMADFLSGRSSQVEAITQPTDISGLYLLPGTGDLGGATLKHQRKLRLVEKLRTLEVDFVLIDLAPGCAYSTLDFYLAADLGVVVLVPELTSIECAYRFLQAAYFRDLYGPGVHEGEAPRTRKLLELVAQRSADEVATPLELIAEIEEQDDESARFLRERLERFRPTLIVNQARTTADGRLPDGLRNVCRRRFGMEVEVLGPVDFDDSVWHSLRRRRPLVLEYPDSSAAKAIGGIARRLMNTQPMRRATVAGG